VTDPDKMAISPAGDAQDRAAVQGNRIGRDNLIAAFRKNRRRNRGYPDDAWDNMAAWAPNSPSSTGCGLGPGRSDRINRMSYAREIERWMKIANTASRP